MSTWSMFLARVEIGEAGPLGWWSLERLGWVLAAILWWVQIGECLKAKTLCTKGVLNARAMEIMFEGPESNKGKGLARNVRLFKGIHKKCGIKRSAVQEMFDSLKSMTDVIIESKSVSSPTKFTYGTAIEVQIVMGMVLSLPGVQSGHRLHMFSSLFFMEN
ncbi:hypothetical protein SO802_026070 [Lithocarpus litseifolius]|uniref:Uncharacterized protein n=1 Tax=Lithocarpus litseifolius TaxID=425828 RepID=A0AAW2BYG3_9ROSI